MPYGCKSSYTISSHHGPFFTYQLSVIPALDTMDFFRTIRLWRFVFLHRFTNITNITNITSIISTTFSRTKWSKTETSMIPAQFVQLSLSLYLYFVDILYITKIYMVGIFIDTRDWPSNPFTPPSSRPSPACRSAQSGQQERRSRQTTSGSRQAKQSLWSGSS